MFSWFKSKFAKYKIIHDPEFGYAALARDWLGWWVIRGNGELGTDLPHASSWRDAYFVSTIEQAGERINKHTTSRGQKTVWEDR